MILQMMINPLRETHNQLNHFCIKKNKKSNESLDEYKGKLRDYAKQFQELNGEWFNMKDIETVSYS